MRLPALNVGDGPENRELPSSLAMSAAGRVETAVGTSVLGAGGGGFFLFYVQPQHRQRVVNAVLGQGCRTQNFRFESCGVTSWRTKIQ